MHSSILEKNMCEATAMVKQIGAHILHETAMC